MKRIIAIMLAGAASTSIAAATDDNASSYRTATSKAAADFKAAKDRCDAMSGNAKTICVDEARAARAHSDAESMVQYGQGSDRARSRAQVAAVDADYALAKAKCADKSGSDKSTCLSEAKTAHNTALAEAKTGRAVAGTGGTSSGAGTTAGTTSGTTSDTSSNTAATTGRDTRSGQTTDQSTNTASNQAGQATTRAGEAVADSVITTKVKAGLVGTRDLSATGIHVETSNGVVMLSGFVNSKTEADKAVEVARGVQGVKQVESAIKVK